MLADILKDNKCFKLICGAGNEDVDEIEKLTALYSQAGCSFFDICANEKVIDAAKKGLKRVGKENSAYLCISVGVESDQHFCKAQIDEQNCIKCGQCKDLCLQQAIEISENKSEVNTKKCIACKKQFISIKALYSSFFKIHRSIFFTHIPIENLKEP